MIDGAADHLPPASVTRPTAPQTMCAQTTRPRSGDWGIMRALVHSYSGQLRAAGVMLATTPADSPTSSQPSFASRMVSRRPGRLAGPRLPTCKSDEASIWHPAASISSVRGESRVRAGLYAGFRTGCVPACRGWAETTVSDQLDGGCGSGYEWPPRCRSPERPAIRSATATRRTTDDHRRTAPGPGDPAARPTPRPRDARRCPRPGS